MSQLKEEELSQTTTELVTTELVTVNSIDSSISSLVDSEGKNSKNLSCLHCNCLLLRPNIGLYVKIEKELPSVMSRSEDTNQSELLSDFWLVSDMFQFENMAFSKNVKDVKYLACAECDIGPIGWHNLSDQKCYIANNRIKHN
ncbi:guanine nucleotide exchange factor MSS4 homolog [Oppia nitens]|uniref:guanine nucleotide exchange factor MSS4 homolog n=1 Tax=Oppia nitens TaxID=1686743 RepID=UPI0023DB2E84|nr:guanine nucleotide exchange factor MSS4 homolog [Oppia nitens]